MVSLHATPSFFLKQQKAGLSLNDMDCIEINEEFIAQTLVCTKESQKDRQKFNISGGAILLGRPFEASGSRRRMCLRLIKVRCGII